MVTVLSRKLTDNFAAPASTDFETEDEVLDANNFAEAGLEHALLILGSLVVCLSGGSDMNFI